MLAWLIWLLVRLLSSTLRWRWSGGTPLLDDGGQRFIFAIWHNRLALSLMLFRRHVSSRFPKRRMAGLVSASRDGGVLAHALTLFGVLPIRGSSSRRGSQALRELVAAGMGGFDLAITPDGPRGPRYHVQDGVIAAAQMTGLPILPTSYRLGWKICLKSWDGFQVPLPFSVCEVRVAEPMFVSADISDAEREEVRAELEARLRAITVD